MAGKIALLVVHGIGAQERGESLGKLLNGLRRVEQNSIPEETLDGVAGTVGGQSVRFYEVYWADLLKGDATRGNFQMTEMQSLSWFPWFNRWRGNYGAGSYSPLKLLWWWVALPLFNFLMLFAYYGAGMFAQIFSGANGMRKEAEAHGAGSGLWRKISGRRATLTLVDKLLDEYLGDVFSYVNSAGEAFHREDNEPAVTPEVSGVYADIVQRFYDQLLKAQEDGCDTIHVVAHSLGTVVTYHALSGFRLEDGRRDAGPIREAIAKVERLYTIGSPLEKIRFFWPRLVAGPPLGANGVKWDNFVSWFDPVAGTLRSPLSWGQVANHRLLGGGFFRGHVVYERSPVFLSALTKGLCGRDASIQSGRGERMRDVFTLVGETLLAPAVLGVVLLAGAGLYVLAALLLPYLLSWTVRWFLPPETWVPIVDTASLVLLGMMTLAFLVAPVFRAKKVHALYWAKANSGHKPGNGT